MKMALLHLLQAIGCRQYALDFYRYIYIWVFFCAFIFILCSRVIVAYLLAHSRRFICTHKHIYVDHILHRNAKQETYSKCLNAVDLSSPFYWPLKRYCTRIICFSFCFTIFFFFFHSHSHSILCVCMCVFIPLLSMCIHDVFF